MCFDMCYIYRSKVIRKKKDAVSGAGVFIEIVEGRGYLKNTLLISIYTKKEYVRQHLWI